MIDRPDATQGPHGLCLDKGYDYPEVYELADALGFSAHIRARGEEARALEREPGFRARRWVVELNRFRGLLIRWSKKPENHRALLQLACGLISSRMATAEVLPG